jgi:hypothetical protein
MSDDAYSTSRREVYITFPLMCSPADPVRYRRADGALRKIAANNLLRKPRKKQAHRQKQKQTADCCP